MENSPSRLMRRMPGADTTTLFLVVPGVRGRAYQIGYDLASRLPGRINRFGRSPSQVEPAVVREMWMTMRFLREMSPKDWK